MNRIALARIIGSGPEEKLIVQRQSVNDIIRQVVIKHKKETASYDKIAYCFDGGSLNDTCRRLFEFCKQNIEYREEPEDSQYTSAPYTILMRGYADCKGYALFIAGVLDALKRRGSDIDWEYRFVSYKTNKPMPGHVFVVVKTNGNEIWVDPVMTSYDFYKPYYYELNKRVRTVPANTLGSCDCLVSTDSSKVGSAQQTGALIQKVSPALAVVPVVGWVAAAAGEVIGFFLIAFGSKYSQSTGVRWLDQLFEYYVLGLPTHSDNKVNEANVPNAQKWFSYVLGVPIYDRYRFDDLKGVKYGSAESLHQTYAQRADEYLKNQDVIDAGVTRDQAIQAAIITDQLDYGAPQGGWKNQLAAPSLVTSSVEAQGQLSTGGTVQATATPVSSLVTNLLTSNAALFAGIGIVVYSLISGKK
jgi:hypothetical protein